VKRNITIRDVAKEAGVSVATISRYLNNNSYVSKDTEEKIKEIMTRLNYKPNEVARGLAKKKSNTLALIIPDITNPFFPELVVAIEEIAKSKGYTLILVNTHESELLNINFWRNFQNRYIDGFILASFQLNKQILEEVENLSIPFVRIDRAVDNESPNSIGINNYEGARMATEHLLEIGCKKIAHLSGPLTFLPAIERRNGFIETAKKHSPNREIISFEGEFTLESGMKITKQLVSEHKDIDGIFLANDLMALGSLKQLKLMGIMVPSEIAIIGFDGIKLTEMVEPEISTIQQPIYDVGVTATNKLINLIENTSYETINQELEVNLIKRNSTLGFIPKEKRKLHNQVDVIKG
jgi:LacI family transcriptional regulator